MANCLNVIFAGTPDFAAQHLQALLDSQHNVIAVYSQPDRPAGRGKKLQASPVKQLALEHGIAVYQPDSLKDAAAQQQLADLQADVMVVVAYGLLLPQLVLDTPRYGCLNVHGSLLPRWRGAAPIQRAIWAGDQHTGVTIMQMDAGLDTGPMLLKQQLAISPQDTSATLYTKLAQIGPHALLNCLQDLANMTAEPQQDDQACYAKKLSKEEAQLDWQLSAAQLERNIRAFNPWPVSFFQLMVEDAPINIKVWQAQVVDSASQQADTPAGEILTADKHGLVVSCADQALRITSLQLPGKKAMSFADVYNAKQAWFKPGHCLP